jgi:hypothetical protein
MYWAAAAVKSAEADRRGMKYNISIVMEYIFHYYWNIYLLYGIFLV